MKVVSSYLSLTRRQRILVGVFGIAMSLWGMWFTENKLNIADSERNGIGFVHRPAEPFEAIRVARKRDKGTAATDVAATGTSSKNSNNIDDKPTVR